MIVRTPAVILCISASLAFGALAVRARAKPPTPVSIQIVWDSYHIPHIFGPTDNSVMYGLGYQQMLDFPLTTLKNLWIGTGRYSESFGKDYRFSPVVPLSEDVVNSAYEHWEIATEQDAYLSANAPLLYQMLTSYVKGINDGRAWWVGINKRDARAKLLANTNLVSTEATLLHLLDDSIHPVNYMKITIKHVLCFGLYINRLSGGPGASNSWLVARNTTVDHAIHTLSDTHITTLEEQFLRGYFVRLRSEPASGLHVAGFTLPGSPCVLVGFNDKLSWTQVFAPASITQSTWFVTLSSVPNETFTYTNASGTQETVAIVTTPKPWIYWDTANETFVNGPTDMQIRRVPTEQNGIVRKYPVIAFNTSLVTDPDYGFSYNVKFHQHSYTVIEKNASGAQVHSGSMWQVFMELAQATQIDASASGTDTVFNRPTYTLDHGAAMFIGATNGKQKFYHMARVPMKGTGPTAAEWKAPMPGNDAKYRWKGIHPLADLPQYEVVPPPFGGLPRVWIDNNVTPEFINSATGNWLGNDVSGNPHIWDTSVQIKTYRQFRAEERLRSNDILTGATLVSGPLIEDTAVDKYDNWNAFMWPYFAVARAEKGTSVPGVDIFINWINDWDQPIAISGEPNSKFFADKGSKRMVYMALLRGAFQRKLFLADDKNKFGLAPIPFIPDFATFQTVGTYGTEKTAMRDALEKVVSDYFFEPGTYVPNPATTPPNMKLWNWDLTNFNANNYASGAQTPTPWSAPVFSDGVNGVIRWGQVNMLVLTPRFVPPNPFIPGLTPYRQLYGLTLPDVITPAPSKSALAVGEGIAQVYPIGGTHESLFVTYGGYADYLFGVSDPAIDVRPVAFVPHVGGSHHLLHVKVPTDSGTPTARFLMMNGGTELSQDIIELTDDNGGAIIQKSTHSIPAQNFCDGTFQEFQTGATPSSITSVTGLPEVRIKTFNNVDLP